MKPMNANGSKFKLVTIIVEPVLAAQISTEVQKLGSSGLTSTEVQGEGNRHLHSGEIPGRKIKFECIVDSVLAKKIMEHISKKYFQDYSAITYAVDVDVLRPDKFQGR